MKRLLPPLLLLLFLGFVVWRTAGEPRRDATRQRIRAGVGPALNSLEARDALLAELESYLAEYEQDLDDRRFAAEAYLRIQEPARAAEALWSHPEFQARPGAGRELAEMILRPVSLLGDDVDVPGVLTANMATLVLAEGGLDEARARVDEVIQTQPWQLQRAVFFGAALYGTDAIRAQIVEDLRARKEPEARTQAALIAMRPDDYPEREGDLERLRDVVEGTHRQEHRMLWSLAAVALGRSGSPEALEILREAATRLGASDAVPDREDGAFAALGLVAGGDMSALAQVEPFLAGRSLIPVLLQWTANTLALRWNAGDEAALAPLQALWRDGRDRNGHSARIWLGYDLFLRQGLPPVGDPVDRLGQELSAADATPSEQLQGVAIGVRRGQEGARDELVRRTIGILRERPLADHLGLVDGLFYSDALQGLRTLYLYDR